MRHWLSIFLLLLPCTVYAELYVTIIEGLGGTEEFAGYFDEQTESIIQATEKLTGRERITVLKGEKLSNREIFSHFKSLAGSTGDNDRIAVFLIGHGSFDGQQYKFNIPGPDITGEDIVRIMDELPSRHQLLVNTSSTSGAIIDGLKSDSRIVITATKSGNERNATRFGSFFVAALSEHSADTNKNESISAEEAFEFANRSTEDFYKSEGRLATEHPQLNGERAAQFNIARLTPEITNTQIPGMGRLLEQRREINSKIENLQLRRDSMENDEFYKALEGLILELSDVEAEIDELEDTE